MDNIKLEKLFNENKDDLQRFINSKVHNSDLAKDLSQDTFIKLINTLRKENYNEEGKFLSYAFAVAHNVIRDHYRKKRPTMIRSDNYKVFSKLESKQLNKEEQIIKDQIIDLVKDLRQRGLNVFVLPQNKNLPFSHTREDILIKND